MVHLFRFFGLFLPFRFSKRTHVLVVFAVSALGILTGSLGLVANIIEVIQVSWVWFATILVASFMFALGYAYLYNRQAHEIEEALLKAVLKGEWLKKINGKYAYEWVNDSLRSADGGEALKVEGYRNSRVPAEVPPPECQDKADEDTENKRRKQAGSTIRLPSTLIIGIGDTGKRISGEILKCLCLITGMEVKEVVTCFPVDPVEYAKSLVIDEELVEYVKRAETIGWKKWLVPPGCNTNAPQETMVALRVRNSRKYGRFLFAANSKKREESFIRKLEPHLKRLRNIAQAWTTRKHNKRFAAHSNVMIIVSSRDREASGMFMDVMHAVSGKLKEMGIDKYVHLYGVVLIPPACIQENRDYKEGDKQLADAFALLDELNDAVYHGRFHDERGEQSSIPLCDQCFLVADTLEASPDRGISTVSANLASMLLADGKGEVSKGLMSQGFSVISGHHLYFDWEKVSDYLGKEDIVNVLEQSLGQEINREKVEHQGTWERVGYQKAVEFSANHQAAAFLRSITEHHRKVRIDERLREEIRNMASNGVTLVNIVCFLDALADYSSFWALKLLESSDKDFVVELELIDNIIKYAGYYAKLYKNLEKKLRTILHRENEELIRLKEDFVKEPLGRTYRYWKDIRNNVDTHALFEKFLEMVECLDSPNELSLSDLQSKMEEICKKPYTATLSQKTIWDLYDTSEALIQTLMGSFIASWRNERGVFIIPREEMRDIEHQEITVISSTTPYWASFLEINYGLEIKGLPLYRKCYNSYYALPWLDRFFARVTYPRVEPKELLLFSLSWSLDFLKVSAGGYRWQKTGQHFHGPWEAFFYLCCDNRGLREDLVGSIKDVRSRKGIEYMRDNIQSFLDKIESIETVDEEMAGMLSCVLENCEHRLDECMQCIERFTYKCAFLEECLDSRSLLHVLKKVE